MRPSIVISLDPSLFPSYQPNSIPTHEPSWLPSSISSNYPSFLPTLSSIKSPSPPLSYTPSIIQSYKRSEDRRVQVSENPSISPSDIHIHLPSSGPSGLLPKSL